MLKLLIIILCIAFPLPAFAQKAKTIDELAAMFDSSRCKECHDVIYEQWEKSQHALLTAR
jgi:ABC-type tungstate transport system substrate-binding protein